MGKINIDVKLNCIMGAVRTNLKGQSGVSKECIVIPVEQLSVDKNNNVWLNLVGYDDTKFERQTHSLKQKLSKAQFDSIPVDDNGRKALTPYCGVVKAEEAQNTQAKSFTSASYGASDDLPAGDGLPF